MFLVCFLVGIHIWDHLFDLNFHEIHCSISKIYDVKKELEKEIKNFISTEIEWIPLNCVKVSKEKNENLENLFNTLEEDDDVQNIYTNAEFIE